MAQPFFSQLSDLIQPLINTLGDDHDIECTHFFSGAAIYVNGQICMSLTPVGFALKLPDAAQQQVLAEGGQPLRYFPSGPVKKGYVLLPDPILDVVDRRTALMKTCIEAASG